MIRHGNQVRLTRKDHQFLTQLTGSDSSYIRTQSQLNLFIEAHLCLYPGRSPEEFLLRGLLEKYLDDPMATDPPKPWMTGVRQLIFLLLFSVCGPSLAITPQTGWWWNPDEPGSGLNLQFQQTTDGSVFMFAAGFVYDDNGQPVWFTTQGTFVENGRATWRTSGVIGSYIGQRFESEGGNCLTCPFVPGATAAIPGSEVTFDFTDTRMLNASFDGFERSYQYLDISNQLIPGLDILDGARVYVSASVSSGEVDGSTGQIEFFITNTAVHTVQGVIRKATAEELEGATLSELDDDVFFIDVADISGQSIGPFLVFDAFTDDTSLPPGVEGVQPLGAIPVSTALTYDRETGTAQIVFPETTGGLDLVNNLDRLPRFRAFVTDDAIVGWGIPSLLPNWEPQDQLGNSGESVTLGSSFVIYRTKPDDRIFMSRQE